MIKLFKYIVILGLLFVVSFYFFREDKKPFEPEVMPEEIGLSDEELSWRIGQMIMIGFRGLDINEEIRQVVTEEMVGGVILFDYDTKTKTYERNIKNEGQVKELISGIQNIATTPLFIAVDAEGGLVNRLKSEKGFLDIPSHEALGKGSPEEVKRYGDLLADELVNLGFNVNFAPVVDVNINPENPIIGKLGRSFSKDPDRVADYAEIFISAFSEKNIVSVIKHFPGHGSSEGDTHKGVVDVTDMYQESEMIPYQTLIRKGVVDAVMSAHIVNRNVDLEFPASLSNKHIQENLRNTLGFDGVVFSDDIDMGAIENEYELEEIVSLAINAGVDVIVSSNNVTGYRQERVLQIKQAILQALEKGDISEERIIESSNRILDLKKKYLIYNQ